MAKGHKESDPENLPGCAAQYIKQVIRKMRYRRKVRADVQAELTAHFEDELSRCQNDQEKEQKAEQVIAGFGDAKLLAVLLRRAKKRCRPLWRTALVRSFQALGIIVLYLLVCLIPLLVGKPTISVNYVDWLNELVRAGRDEQDNARPYYEKAIKLYVEMPQWLRESRAIRTIDLNDVQITSLSTWLDDNKQAVEAFRQGTRCPGYWSKYHSDETELSKAPLSTISMTSAIMADAMEILPNYRHLAFAMRWQIRYEAHNRDIETALSDSVALAKFAGHLHGHGLLVEQLVGIAIEGLAHKEILMILEKQDVPADVLKNTQEDLNKQFCKPKPIISLEAEKVFWYDAIQRTFTDDGQGGGRMLLRGLPYVATDDWKEMLWRFVSFDYPDRREIVKTIDYHFGQFDELLARTPHDLYNEEINDQAAKEADTVPLMLGILLPAHRRVSQIAWRMKTGREALLTVLAIMRYEKEKGQYPASLDELVEAGYLKKLPMDPYAEDPLIYKKTDTGFVLYSVGPDFTDNGGEPGRDSKGQIKNWRGNGDTVFWPVPKSQTQSSSDNSQQKSKTHLLDTTRRAVLAVGFGGNP